MGPGHRNVARLCLVAVLMSGCAAAKKVIPYPTASVEGVDIESVTLSSLTLRFDIEVENPYGTSLPVIGLNYDLAASGRRFLEGRIEASESIPAGASRILPMSIEIPFTALSTAVETFRPGAQIPYEAKLGLEVDAPLVGGVELPMRKEGELSLPALP